MADQLSPANQVMIAVAYVYQEHGGEPPARAVAAAALRAAADQVGPKETLPFGHIYSAPAEEWHYQFKLQAKNKLLAIATELENRNG